MENSMISRRTFLGSCATVITGTALANVPDYLSFDTLLQPGVPGTVKPTVCAFSKMFDFLGKDMFSFLAEAGFEGIDLTVRPGGFVSYENVEKELTDAVDNAQKNGLSIPMIATDITNASDKVASRVLKVASDLGVSHYRMGYYPYQKKLSMDCNLEIIKKSFLEMAELNSRLGIQGNYQNHVGGAFGGAIWDLWAVIRQMDCRYIASQYDVRHAVVEGFTSWKSALKAICPHIGTLCIKDFVYEEHNEKWEVRSVPLGTGVVDFDSYMKIIKENKVQAPMSVHYEFPLLSGNDNSLSNIEKMKKMLPLVEKEVSTLKGFWNK